MKKLISLLIVMILCCSCAGCGASEKEAVVTESASQEIVETVPQETIAVTEAVPVLEEPDKEQAIYLNFNFGYEEESKKLEVFDCRMYPTGNGTTIFAADYKTIAGLLPVVYGFADDGDNDPNYCYEAEYVTTDEESTLVFEMEDSLLEQIYQPVILFRDQYGFYVSELDIFHREQRFMVTDGNPIGEPTEWKIAKYGNVSVYSANMQELDNGYIRFTVDCKPQKDRYISFYNPPEGKRFMFISQEPTTGARETIVLDVRKELVEGLHDINLNFFNGDAPVARIYLTTPVEEFAELVPDYFAAFIGGNGKLAVLYYGVMDEAALGATLTAEDGTSVDVTEKVLDKNGDGHTLIWFKEYKAKRNDTINVTLSKEGYEDISLELYVH